MSATQTGLTGKRKTIEKSLFSMFPVSCWRVSSFQNFSLTASIHWHILNSACQKAAQTHAAAWSFSSHDHQMSLSHGICVPSLKINSTQTNEALTVVTNPDPHTDASVLESTATRSAGCNFKEAPDTQVTQRRTPQAGMEGAD